jgi:hypothetical protein
VTLTVRRRRGLVSRRAATAHRDDPFPSAGARRVDVPGELAHEPFPGKHGRDNGLAQCWS